VTPPKKWPERAEWARLDTIALLDDIRKYTRSAQELLADGHNLQAMFVLGQIADKATVGREKLNEAKHG
jgi:hypothetical protein